MLMLESIFNSGAQLIFWLLLIFLGFVGIYALFKIATTAILQAKKDFENKDKP